MCKSNNIELNVEHVGLMYVRAWYGTHLLPQNTLGDKIL